MIDYRFSTAVQIVFSLAIAEQSGRRCTSFTLASEINANPSCVRKLMVSLTRDGIIQSSLGRTGAVTLGRPADDISFRDIYISVLENKILWPSRLDIPRRCYVSMNLQWYYRELAGEANEAMLDVLAAQTVADALSNPINRHEACAHQRPRF